MSMIREVGGSVNDKRGDRGLALFNQLSPAELFRGIDVSGEA
jgi:hypothetical protein